MNTSPCTLQQWRLQANRALSSMLLELPGTSKTCVRMEGYSLDVNRLCTEPASEPDFLSFGLDAPQAQTQIIKSVFMFVTYKHMSNNYLASFASVASQSVQTVCVFKGEGAERKMLRKRFR